MTGDTAAHGGWEPATRVQPPGALSPALVDALESGAAAAQVDAAVLSLTGSGTVTCLQGMLTSDIEGPGREAFVYGAALTPKGMIVTDLWLARHGEDARLFVPPLGKEPLLEIFRRSLPPRLSRVEDRSAETAVLRVVGPESASLSRDAGLECPDPGQTIPAECAGWPCHIARPCFDEPFGIQISCARDDASRIAAALTEVGVVPAGSAALEAARVISGWPLLGAEIGPRTLPQEVRFDEIGGVSYTKGCFTGQETVARLHFRGRANRWLAGLTWDTEPDPDVADIIHEGKIAGRVSSIVWLPVSGQIIGLGVVRREITAGSLVDAAGAPGVVSILPFDIG